MQMLFYKIRYLNSFSGYSVNMIWLGPDSSVKNFVG